MTFIGYNYDGYPISIVVAKSKELAYAYWQGKGILPHYHECVEEDYSSLDEHPTGVFPIMNTVEVSDYNLSNNMRNPNGRKIIMVDKK